METKNTSHELVAKLVNAIKNSNSKCANCPYQQSQEFQQRVAEALLETLNQAK